MKEMSLDEVKNCSLDILKWVDGFCAENNITWWLCGGTLLGAVRHKGFIPWDDDIDIMLPREEYEKLLRLFPTSGRYRFLTPENTENWPRSFAKIVDTETVKLERLRKRFPKVGVDIDVFPIDNLPSDESECGVYFEAIKKMGRKLDGMRLVYGKGKSITRTILKYGFIFWSRLLEFIGVYSFEETRREFVCLSTKYNSQECEYWGITSISHYGIKERNLKKGYENSVIVDFEGCQFPAPECYDTYLSQLYGKDYMQLPPKEKQVTHHAFKAYWKE